METTNLRKIEMQVWALFKYFNRDLANTILNSENISKYIQLQTDISNNEFVYNKVASIIRNRNQLIELLNSPQVKQRSEEWFALRRDRLTASDTGQSMNRGKFGNRADLLKKKAFPDSEKPLSMNIPPLRHGIMFEPMTSRCYAQRHNDITIYDFGLIPHPTMACYGASPDGITETGVMLEFKTPWKRRVDGHIPEQYELQMQGQMAVTGIDECDYVDCKMIDYRSIDDYLNNVKSDELVDHGIVIEYIVGDDHDFVYSDEYKTPDENIKWMNAIIKGEKRRYKIVPWKMEKMYIERLYFDKKRWDTEIKDKIEEFWDEVMRMRANTPSVKKEVIEEKRKYEFIDSDSD